MNQINPAGLPTIYYDNNAIIVGSGGVIAQDSQFKVSSAAVFVTAGVFDESTTILQGAWTFVEPIGTEFDVAQIVYSGFYFSGFPYKGRIITIENGQTVINEVTNFPEPSGAVSGDSRSAVSL